MRMINFINNSKNIFQNWNKDMYVARKKYVTYDDYNNEIVVYDKPFYFGKVNYQPLTGKNLEDYMRAYGETRNNIVSCLIDSHRANEIRDFDLVYLYGKKPVGEQNYGDNANYLVRAYKPQNTKIMLLFEEIIKED